jgi:uncharacterized glyoxalase superfamily protein PhnB
MTRLHTYLNFAGNAEEAFNFYQSIFGGELSSVVRFKDLPMEGVSIPEEDQDKMMHIALPIGDDSILMASDALRSLGQELVQATTSTSRSTPTARRRLTGYSAPCQTGASWRCRSVTRRGGAISEA